MELLLSFYLFVSEKRWDITGMAYYPPSENEAMEKRSVIYEYPIPSEDESLEKRVVIYEYPVPSEDETLEKRYDITGLSMYRRKAKYSTAHEVRHERYDKKLSHQVHVPETLPEREQEPEKQEAAPHGSRHDH